MSLALFLGKLGIHRLPPLEYARCFQSRATRLYTLVHPFVYPSICWSIHHILLFCHLWGFWACRSCPIAPLTSNMAPNHQHATWVALYQALLVADWLFYKRLCPSMSLSISLCAQVAKSSISTSAHPSAAGIGCVSGFVLSFLGHNKSFP